MDRREKITVIVKGAIMGTSHVIPGVSGATMALVLGIYSRLVASVSSLGIRSSKDIFRGLKEFEREELLKGFDRGDFNFLLLLSVGVAFSLVLSVFLMESLLSNHSVKLFSFFSGLILASSIVMLRDLRFQGFRTVFYLLTGSLIAFSFSGLAATGIGHSGLLIFLSGFFSVGSFIVPGISGAVVLVIMGQYGYMISVAETFLSGLGNLSFFSVMPEITVFGAGGLLGLWVFSNSIDLLLERYRKPTSAFLVGLVIGSLRAPLVEISRASGNLGNVLLSPGIILVFFLGLSAIFLMDYVVDVDYWD